MNKISHISLMAQLKHIDLVLTEASTADKEVLKRRLLHTLGYEVSILDVRNIEAPHLEPSIGQYINEFLEMGYTQTKVAEWFETTPANVSYHFTKPKKKEYQNNYLTALERSWHTQTE